MNYIVEFGNVEFWCAFIRVFDQFVHEGEFSTEEFALEFDRPQNLFNLIHWKLVLVNCVVTFVVFWQSIVQVFVVCVSPQFLLTYKLARHRPYFIVMSWVFICWGLFKKYLSISKYVFEWIHCREISSCGKRPWAIPGPFMPDHPRFSHFFLCFIVWYLDPLQHCIKPLLYELSAFRSDNEVVFIGQMPLRSGMVLRIILPVQRWSI